MIIDAKRTKFFLNDAGTRARIYGVAAASSTPGSPTSETIEAWDQTTIITGVTPPGTISLEVSISNPHSYPEHILVEAGGNTLDYIAENTGRIVFAASADRTVAIAVGGVCTFAGTANPDFTHGFHNGLVFEIGGKQYVLTVAEDNSTLTARIVNDNGRGTSAVDTAVVAGEYTMYYPTFTWNFSAGTSGGLPDIPATGALNTSYDLSLGARLGLPVISKPA